MATVIETKNAVIESTMLGIEDHGILSYMIHLSYGGAGQGFGGYAMDEPTKKDGKFAGRRGAAFGAESIRRLLEVVGVSRWEDLPGKSVRATADMSKVYKIGHYLKDEWLDLEKLAKEMA